MDAKTLQVAREWARAGLCDPTISNKLRTNHRALILQSMEPGGLATVTQATKNGVSMGKTMGLSIPDTLTAINSLGGWKKALSALNLSYFLDITPEALAEDRETFLTIFTKKLTNHTPQTSV